MPPVITRRQSLLALLGTALGFGLASGGAPNARAALPAASVRLLDSFVAGDSYYDAEKALHALAVGQKLILRREPGNRYDGRAIEVFAASGHKLGYVPRYANQPIAALLDAGRDLVATVTSLGGEEDGRVRPETFGGYRRIGFAIEQV